MNECLESKIYMKFFSTWKWKELGKDLDKSYTLQGNTRHFKKLYRYWSWWKYKSQLDIKSHPLDWRKFKRLSTLNVDIKEQKLLYIDGGIVKWYKHVEYSLAVYYEVIYDLYDSEIILPGVWSRKI